MSKLYVVPTPIGNLKDITFRAIEVLQSVDFILAEDTRQTIKLLQHYQINKKIQAYHQHNEHHIVDNLIDQIQGKTVALVSDAGTPGLSDPGFLLIRACLQNDIAVETLPGATALIPALVNSGLPCDRFCFEGFLPHKKGKKTKVERLASETRTIIFYESPYRLVKTLALLSEIFGKERKACVSREISKIFEENKRGTLHELSLYFAAKEVKGEIVLIVAGCDGSSIEINDLHL